MTIPSAPVLILGAGINGICAARELVLNGVPVWLVDTHDIAFGATAKSSRLIHGGLRYLEYGDFRLVAESLHERDRLLRLAPQFVRPLRLHIPIRRRLGGFIAAGFRFLGLSRTGLGKWIGSGGGRGLITVRCGLWLYDLLARSRMVPKHAVHRTGAGGPQFPVSEYPWSCAYFDGQMERPERFCVALLRDIEEAAEAQGTEFRLLTYHRAILQGNEIEIRPVAGKVPLLRPEGPSIPPAQASGLGFESIAEFQGPTARPFDRDSLSNVRPFRPENSQEAHEPGPSALAMRTSSPSGRKSEEHVEHAEPAQQHYTSSPLPLRLTPSLIINATGAWGDWTLMELPMQAPQLFGGTKGTHLFTHQSRLTEALGGDAVYAEASDGRLVFLIPLDSGVMIGTTDERFEQRPDLAHSTETETAYLLKLTNDLFPQVHLTEADIHATCAGVRPLPYSDASKTAAISRDHQIDHREVNGLPVLTLIGGKLTTCRAFGEWVGDQVMKRLGVLRTVSTLARVVPGGEGYPVVEAALEKEIDALARATGHTRETCRTVWRLVGTQAREVLPRCVAGGLLMEGTALPCDFVREIITQEWVTTLEDLVERRLLLALEPKLSRETLRALAVLLYGERPGMLSIDEMVDQASQRLRNFYARKDV